MDTPDSVNVTPCACGKAPEACAMTQCSAKLAAAAPAPEVATAQATPETASTVPASDPTASLATILAGLPKDKLPALVDMFQRLGAAPAGDPKRPVDAGGGGVKEDVGKPALTMIPTSALFGMGRVLAFGAKKYERDNWRKGMNYTRVLDAALRHIMAIVDGESIDPETGELHAFHAMCCLAFLGEYQTKGTGRDDRYKAPA